MTRDEIVELRERLFALVAELEKLGDYDVNARFIRGTAQTLLKMIDHVLERMRRPA